MCVIKFTHIISYIIFFLRAITASRTDYFLFPFVFRVMLNNLQREKKKHSLVYASTHRSRKEMQSRRLTGEFKSILNCVHNHLG